MNTDLEKVIKNLCALASRKDIASDDALRYTQSIINAINARAIVGK